MKTMKWLIRREFWEHKGAFFWAPVIVALGMVVFLGGTVAYAVTVHGIGGVTVVNGHKMRTLDMLNAMPLSTRTDIANVIANSYLLVAAPLFGVLAGSVFYYCLAALYNDRRDRSILFWKSLPISDQMTVLSKVLTAVCVAPVITIAVGTAASLLIVLIGLTAVASGGLNLFGLVLSNLSFYLAPLQLLGLVPVYILWAIPTVGWLLMVSAWARSKVFLWAVGVPILLMGLARWANFITAKYMDAGFDVDWFVQNVVARFLGGLMPGIWLPYGHVSRAALQSPDHLGADVSGVFTQSWMTLTQPGVWVGVLIGGAMIFAAIRLRRWRDEG